MSGDVVGVVMGRELAAEVAGPVERLGGAFMVSREAKAFATETRIPGWGSYFRGRCGVLGDVDADVVAAAVGFFPAEVVRQSWEAGKDLPPAQAAERYARVAGEFGKRKLAGLEDADARRLAELLQQVSDNADVMAAPLFAGWRAMALPEDPRARVVQLAHVVRELRAGLHLVAVLASGLSPLDAVLSGAESGRWLLPRGEANAEFFGWPRPYPEVTDEIQELRARAEELTNVLMAPACAGLDREESAELLALLGRAEKVAFN